MALSEVVQDSFRRSIDLYHDLISELPEPALAMKLPGVRSNAIGAQLWCVVGARESFSRAIEGGKWAGFSCSLTSDGSRQKAVVQEALSTSAATLLSALRDLGSYDDARNRFIVDLLEHEVAHQGQLIRYLYGLKLPIPARWKARYALD